MKYNYRKLLIGILMMTIILCVSLSIFAHSGRTDSSGGHKDNKNVSGLGSYHYHCGGHPAHLHKNGVCPYASKSSKSTYSSSKSSSSANKSSSSSSNKVNSYSSSTTNSSSSTKPTSIIATKIEINQESCSMEIGDTKKLTASIEPNNATDKTITWKSNDESIATINNEGEIKAKKSGVVNIIASTSNQKTDTIEVYVKEKSIVSVNNKINSTTSNGNKVNEDSGNGESNSVLGVLGLGLIGIGGYLGYKKCKNNK